MEKQQIEINGRKVPLTVRRHRAARRISLRLTPSAQEIILTLPMRGNVDKAMRFLHSRAGWLAEHLAPAHTLTAFDDGASLPILGRHYTLRRMNGRGVAGLTQQELHIYGAPEFAARRVRDFLQKHMQPLCLTQAQTMAQRIDRKLRSVTISDTRSRWGSCSAKGDIALHWRLAFAPPEILEYLIAHEVAHLAHMNHSTKFWQVVALLCPEYKQRRLWLKRHGQQLYHYT